MVPFKCGIYSLDDSLMIYMYCLGSIKIVIELDQHHINLPSNIGRLCHIGTYHRKLDIELEALHYNVCSIFLITKYYAPTYISMEFRNRQTKSQKYQPSIRQA